MRYQARIRWTGSTGLGWDSYDRTHTASAPPAEAEIGMTTGESKGDPRLNNPEQLVVMAASSCQMLWFLHLAGQGARRRGRLVELAHRQCNIANSLRTEVIVEPAIELESAQGG